MLGERYEIQPIVDEVARIHDLLVKLDGNGGGIRPSKGALRPFFYCVLAGSPMLFKRALY